MKNFWNIFLISTAILAIGIFIVLNHWMDTYIEPFHYDKAIDKKELKLCNTDRIPQYYQVSTAYKGGKKAILKRLMPSVEKERISFGTKDGNITIRFVVNCEGQTGLFRAKGTDKNIKATDYDKSKVESLISLVAQLTDWHAGSIRDKTYDSYYFINFKIENGQVIDIF